MIDGQQKWSGGTARLVQTGDFLDRGTDVREAIDLLMRLEGEARRAGGRVDVLFGNHEGMNVLHDFRDVSPQAFERFADARSDERQRKAFETHAGIAKRNGATLDRDAWMAAHPRGSIDTPRRSARRAPTAGGSGHARRSCRSATRIFMHAGLNPDRTITVEEVNRTVEQEVRELGRARGRARTGAGRRAVLHAAGDHQRRAGRDRQDRGGSEDRRAAADYVTPRVRPAAAVPHELRELALIESDGPLWYRGLATLPDDRAAGDRRAARSATARSRIVLGHTPQLPGPASAPDSAAWSC